MHVCRCLQSPEDCVRLPEVGGDFELSGMVLELHLEHPKEKYISLTTEPPFQLSYSS